MAHLWGHRAECAVHGSPPFAASQRSAVRIPCRTLIRAPVDASHGRATYAPGTGIRLPCSVRLCLPARPRGLRREGERPPAGPGGACCAGTGAPRPCPSQTPPLPLAFPRTPAFASSPAAGSLASPTRTCWPPDVWRRTGAPGPNCLGLNPAPSSSCGDSAKFMTPSRCSRTVSSACLP